MDTFSEKELERLRKLEQLRRLLQTILSNHLRLLTAGFVLILAGILTLVYLRAAYSPKRYEAQAILYYYPKQTGNIQSYNAKYVLQVLSRNALRHQFLLENNNEIQEKNGASPQIMVAAIERNRNIDRFDIRISSRFRDTAIKLTNEFSEHCIRAYTEDRVANLQEIKDSLLKKKNDIFQEIQRLDRERSAMGAPISANAMEKEYELLHTKLTEMRQAQAKLKLSIGSLENRCAMIRKKQTKLNPMLVENDKLLKEQIAAFKQLDQEVMLAENLYTEQNPKLIALMSRRDAMCERLKKLSGEKEIDDSAIERLNEIVELSASLKGMQEELEERREEMRILTQELDSTSARFDRLCEIMPKTQMINQQYTNLKTSLTKIDASISDINYLMPLVKDDLKIGEYSNSALGIMPFSKKNIFICVFAALSLTMLLASLTVILEFWLGKVSSDKELSIIPELRYLGKLPAAEGMFDSKRQEQISFSAICHNFQSAEVEHHIVLAGTLPGGKIIPSLFEAFEWTYAMSGKRTIAIETVLADNFDYESYPVGDTGIIVYSGGKGFLPLVSKNYMSPSEQMLLKQDLETLRESYDLIFIKHSLTLRNDRLFLEQIISLCDGAMIAIGAKKTSRKLLRQLIAVQKRTALPIMTILSHGNSKRSSKKADMEA